MMKKCFVLCQFGTPHPWTQQFINHVQHQKQFGWYWKIFTPNNFESKGNVEIVPMTVEQFNDLVEKKTGVRPNLAITEDGIPNLHITDFYVATGKIFEDYLKEFDFWGITNIDVVYGRLDHYLPDSELDHYDVFTDDVDTINGVFCLFRNREDINVLYQEIPHWDGAFAQPPCPGCTKTGTHQHQIAGTDEYGMTEVMKHQKRLRYGYPQYYPFHSYDRLPQHKDEVMLGVKPDGTLIEIFRDSLMEEMPHQLLFKRGHFGREIMYFHFLTTKKWPNIRQL